MTKTQKFAVAGVVFAATLGLFAYVGITAYAASSLFGGASLGLGYVSLVSDGSDVDTGNDFSGISFDDVNGELFSNLAILSTDFDVTDDSCGGGSPRFQIAVDTDADTVSNGNIFVYLGPSPSFSGCVGQASSGNLIGNEEAGRWDYTQLGGPLGGYSGAPANVLNGTIVGISIVVDGYWSAAASGGDNEQTVNIDNVTIAKLISTTYQFNPPPDVTVTLAKYVDGAHATAASATSLSFPMSSCWDATNIGAGCGNFALSTVGFNNPNEYKATTSFMTNGADYSTNEDLTGSNVGAACSEGKPFALVGYTVGEDEADAAADTPSTTAPSLTDITTNKFIIVWNETCVPAPTTGTLTLEKTVVIDDGGGPANDTDWTLSASGPTPISGVEGNASVTNAVVNPGSYDLSEAGGPSGFTASAWVCTGATQNDSDTVTIAAGETVTCTITNDDDGGPPPPPSGTACDTPGTAPSGYTLVNGTVDRDVVTLAPSTMFVGLGGNDDVRAPTLGNYIICVGNGFDKITVGDGEFAIAGGDNYKNIVVGNGNGTIFLLNGPNRIVAGNGNHTITVGDGNNNITTGTGVDTITTGNGHNRIVSGGGNDDIETGSGNDNVNGGAGTDTCDADGGFNNVTNCEA